MYNDIFELAKKTALSSTSRFRVGAVLVNGKVRIYGTNLMHKSHPQSFRPERNAYCGIHAEQLVLNKAKHHTVGATIVIARVNRNSELVLAKPCDLCIQLLFIAKPKRVFYSVVNGWRGYEHG